MPPRSTPAPPPADAEGAAMAELAAQYVAPVGVQGAVAFLRSSFDEEAHVLWTTGGPRKSHVDEVAAVLCEIGDARRVVLVTGLQSGSFKLYAEVPSKLTDHQAAWLTAMFSAEPVFVAAANEPPQTSLREDAEWPKAMAVAEPDPDNPRA